MSVRIISALTLLAGTVTVSGCAVPAEGQGGLGKTEEAIGEMSCAQNYMEVDPNVGAWMVAHWCFSPNILTTPTMTYDSYSCPEQWIAEFTNTAGHTFTPKMYFDGAPSSTSCANNHGALTVFTYDSLTNKWSSMGTTYVHGSWDGAACSLTPDLFFAWKTVSASPYTTKIRAVGQLITGSENYQHKSKFQVGWTTGC